MERSTKRNLRILSGFVAAAIVIAVSVLYINVHQKIRIKINGTILPKPRVIQPFQLIDTQGKPFTKYNLKGHWTLMFFGFTNCGYVCPTTLSELNKAYETLKTQLPANLLPQVIMVSVDPKRDSIKRLKNYVQTVNPKFIGLRGNLTETKAFANRMSIAFTKVNLSNGNSTISHSSQIILLDPQGNVRAFFSYPQRAETIVQNYKTIVQAFQKQK